jgi:hypothetical protein
MLFLTLLLLLVLLLTQLQAADCGETPGNCRACRLQHHASVHFQHLTRSCINS